MVGFKFGTLISKKTNNECYYVDIHFTDKWYKRIWLNKKQYDCLQAVTITVTE